jgi:hypothetical protein
MKITLQIPLIEAFVDKRFLTITAYVRRVKWKYWKLIGTVHEPETCSSDKHVKIYRTVSGEDAFQCVGKFLNPTGWYFIS